MKKKREEEKEKKKKQGKNDVCATEKTSFAENDLFTTFLLFVVSLSPLSLSLSLSRARARARARARFPLRAFQRKKDPA